MLEEPKKRTRYSRSPLSGEIEVVYSNRLKFPKYHVNPDCEGASATPEEARGRKTFESATYLGLDSEGRPCRMCSLESVLRTVFADHPGPEKVFVSFTAQENPRNPDVDVFSFNWSAATESGQRRVRRLARRGGLSVVRTTAGSTAYGYVNRAVADVLAHNLRTLVRETAKEVPDAAVIECMWALLNDDPPELAEQLNRSTNLDAWETARLLLA